MYFYLDHYEQEIEHNTFLCILLIYISKEEHVHTICKCYTKNDVRIKEKLNTFDLFDDEINDFIIPKPKSDGKIKLTLDKNFV